MDKSIIIQFSRLFHLKNAIDPKIVGLVIFLWFLNIGSKGGNRDDCCVYRGLNFVSTEKVIIGKMEKKFVDAY